MAIISIINDEISDRPKEVIKFLKENTLTNVEVRSFLKKNIADISLFKARKYASQFKKNGIKVTCISSPLLKWQFGTSDDQKSFPKINNHYYNHRHLDFEKIFKIADIFDAKFIRIFSFLKDKHINISDFDTAIYRLLSLAEKHDKTLLIENEPVCNVNSLKHIAAFVGRYDHKRLKVLLDLGNIYSQNDRLDYSQLSKVAEKIAYIHIKDYSFSEKTFKVLGEGDINYKKFFSWIKENGNHLIYSLETHVTDRYAGSAKSLKELRVLIRRKRVKYGIIGCGRIFNKHAQAIKSCPNSELVGVFDIDSCKGEEASITSDCQRYAKLDSLISDVEVINICTPHFTHHRLMEKVLERGKFCLCEKPGGLNGLSPEKVSRRRYLKKAFVVYQNRYNATISKLREIIASKKLGKILYIAGSVRWFRDEEYYRLSSWQGRKEKEGGILFNQGAHILDLILSFSGSKDVSIINSFKDCIYHKEIDTEDIFLADFKIGDTLVHLEVNVSSLPSNLDSNLCMIFEKGRVLINGKSLETSLKLETLSGERMELEFAPNKDIYGLTHQLLISDLSNYVLTGKKSENLVGYKEANIRTELISKLYKAA